MCYSNSRNHLQNRLSGEWMDFRLNFSHRSHHMWEVKGLQVCWVCIREGLKDNSWGMRPAVCVFLHFIIQRAEISIEFHNSCLQSFSASLIELHIRKNINPWIVLARVIQQPWHSSISSFFFLAFPPFSHLCPHIRIFSREARVDLNRVRVKCWRPIIVESLCLSRPACCQLYRVHLIAVCPA